MGKIIIKEIMYQNEWGRLLEWPSCYYKNFVRYSKSTYCYQNRVRLAKSRKVPTQTLRHKKTTLDLAVDKWLDCVLIQLVINK